MTAFCIGLLSLLIAELLVPTVLQHPFLAHLQNCLLGVQALEERLRLVRAQRNKLLSAFETLKGSGRVHTAPLVTLGNLLANTTVVRFSTQTVVCIV